MHLPQNWSFCAFSHRGKAFEPRVFACFALTMAAMVACNSDTTTSDNINENQVWGYYAARLDKGTGILSIVTQFRLGGNQGDTIALKAPSRLAYEGQELTAKQGSGAGAAGAGVTLFGTFYALDKVLPATVPMGVKFVWTRNDASEVVNEITFVPISTASPVKNQVVKRSVALESVFSTEGTDMASIRCALESAREPAPTENKRASGSAAPGAKVCILTAEILAKLPAGKALFYFEREDSGVPKQGHDSKGGKVESFYISEPIEVVVAD